MNSVSRLVPTAEEAIARQKLNFIMHLDKGQSTLTHLHDELFFDSNQLKQIDRDLDRVIDNMTPSEFTVVAKSPDRINREFMDWWEMNVADIQMTVQGDQ